MLTNVHGAGEGRDVGRFRQSKRGRKNAEREKSRRSLVPRKADDSPRQLELDVAAYIFADRSNRRQAAHDGRAGRGRESRDDLSRSSSWQVREHERYCLRMLGGK